MRQLVLAGAFLGLSALLATPLAAQEPAPPDTAVVRDTIPAADAPRRHPRDAFIRSMIIPGWGQAWVGAPGRGGVYFAMEAGALWMVYKSHQKLREAQQQEAWLREIGELAPQQDGPLVGPRRQQREDWITLAIFLLFFSGADAFVAAYLADFDEHIGVLPVPGGGMRFEATIPVGRRR